MNPLLPLLFAPAHLAERFDGLVALGDGWLSRGSVGSFRCGEAVYDLPKLVFSGPSSGGASPIRLGVFAGLHGDEPAGVEASLLFLKNLVRAPSQARGYELHVYPAVNPTGCEDGTRCNRRGRDLNREFWRGSPEPEVRLLEPELRSRAFHGIVALHADDTSVGLYGYAHDRLLNEALLRPALAASEHILPRDPRPLIDGFSATDGVIHQCFCGVLAAPPEQSPRPFDVIFETPALAPLDAQAKAAAAALQAILDAYRGFIAHGQDL